MRIYLMAGMVLWFSCMLGCIKREDPQTYWSNYPYVIDYMQSYTQTLAKLQGQVKDAEDVPLCDVLVEVIKHPKEPATSGDSVLDEILFHSKRIALTYTGENGEFEIADLEPGKYAVLFSRKDFETMVFTHVYIVGNSGSPNGDSMEIWMRSQ